MLGDEGGHDITRISPDIGCPYVRNMFVLNLFGSDRVVNELLLRYLI